MAPRCLVFFEKSLQDRVPGVTLPWWNWTMRHGEGIPPAYKATKDADDTPNPLRGSPIQKSGREPDGPAKTNRTPGASGAPLHISEEFGDRVLMCHV